MVTLITSTEELIEQRKNHPLEIGFVPTMGNLHAGHISLLEEALTQFKTVYFSIFVNPKQFGPNEDFNRYPRTLENDLKLIEQSTSKFPNSEVIVYSPKNPEEVFPVGKTFTLEVLGLSSVIEGKQRPGHFQGVATVVWRLFELIKPKKAYFGLKDYQQYLVIKQMIQDLASPIEIIGMPIVREAEGLALSSRNQYLTPDQKKDALHFYSTLQKISNLLDGKKNNLKIVQDFINHELNNPAWNYLEMRDADSLSDDLSNSQKITILGVYQQGTTRLLDNMQVELS